MKYTLYTAAKINLGLEIISKRKDNYHNLDMIMQSVSLFDKMTVETTSDKCINVSHLKPINCNLSEDIVYKCARIFFEDLGIQSFGINVTLNKPIPICAGLGGGSSNGAGILVALNHLHDNYFSIDELKQIGAKIGADIPFCISGGTARASGTGTILKSIPTFSKYWIVLVKPNLVVSTKEAYNLIDNAVKKDVKNFDNLEQSIIENNLQKLSANMFNRFECITHQIDTLKKDLIDLGAMNSIMSGSGPTVYGIFESKSKASYCFESLKNKYPNTFLCNPIDYGIKLT